MEVMITARHCTVPDSVREQTRRRLARMERLGGRPTSAAVNFEADHGQRMVEARLAVAGGPPLVAQGNGPTHRAAMDRALDRLERQLKRRRQRRRQRRAAAPRTTP